MNKDEMLDLMEGWQDSVNLIAKLANVPAGLIMRLNEDRLEVFVSSETDNNPYEVGDNEVMLNSGLYCETVINADDVLKIPNALIDEAWKNNPDVKLNMISYLGYPLHWPDKTPFGTICVLDNKENHYNEEIELLVLQFCRFIEMHLTLLDNNKKLTELSSTDPLTKVLNRRAFFERTKTETERSIRYGLSFSIVMLDVDHFKKVNDLYGHQFGDEVLIAFANEINKNLRTMDFNGRYGGEEFILVFPETKYESAKALAERLLDDIRKMKFKCKGSEISITTCAGVSEWTVDKDITHVINQADKALYLAKETGRDRVC